MDKYLSYQDNDQVICVQCHKPRYMGYTDKEDRELCCCKGQDMIATYDKKSLVKIEQIKEAIEKAARRESQLTPEVLEVPGFTSIRIRHLLNNLGAISNNYLEIGTHRGSHYCSTVFNNHLKNAVAIDNYSEFYKDGETKEDFLSNSERFLPKETTFTLIEADCFTIKQLDTPGKFDLYNYDALHSESAQQRAVSCFLSMLEYEFIFVVDDWQFNGVEAGTRNGIKLSNLEILFEQILETKEGEQPNEAWHNGFAVFLLKQTKND